jgi:hypothetical protein
LVYDITFVAYDGDLAVTLRGVNATDENNKEIGMDALGTPATGFIVSYGVESDYSMTSASVRTSYAGANYYNEQQLEAYKCSAWDFEQEQCDGIWASISATQDLGGDYFTIETSSLSGFSVKQLAYCGDGVCAGGEDTISCPSDCQAPVTKKKTKSYKSTGVTGGPVLLGEWGQLGEEGTIKCYQCVEEVRIGKTFNGTECPNGWTTQELVCWNITEGVEPAPTPPEQTGWLVPNGTVMQTDAFGLLFAMDKPGNCRWSFSDDGYDGMVNDCTGDGSTSISCPITGLVEGANDIYLACMGSNGAKDSADTNTHLVYNYTLAPLSPATGLALFRSPFPMSLAVIAVITAIAAAYLAVTEIGGFGKKKTSK